jgi:hypothetical protein
MADNSHDRDQAERLRRLQERRAASGRAGRLAATTPESGAPEPDAVTATRLSPQPRNTLQRRPHPAAATRVLLAGLSVASFFAIGGTVAVANLKSIAASTATAAPTGTATAANSATPRRAGAANATTQVVAHTTSGGSAPPP